METGDIKHNTKSIKELIGNEPISIYCSPYIRTKQTLHGIISQLEGNQIVNAREEPRLTGTYSLNIYINQLMIKVIIILFWKTKSFS